MAHTSITIADAIVTDLNAQSFSIAFTAERLYRPLFELKDLKTIHVSVVPRSLGSVPLNRAEFSNLVATDIAIQRKLTATEQADNTAADALMALAQEILNYLTGHALTAVSDALWVEITHDPIYAPEHWEQYGQFTSVLTVIYNLPIARS